MWLNNSPIPAAICQQGAKDYGFYRRIEGGKLEFVSFCSTKAKDWVAIHKEDLERLLKKIAEGDQKGLQNQPLDVKY